MASNSSLYFPGIRGLKFFYYFFLSVLIFYFQISSLKSFLLFRFSLIQWSLSLIIHFLYHLVSISFLCHQIIRFQFFFYPKTFKSSLQFSSCVTSSPFSSFFFFTLSLSFVLCYSLSYSLYCSSHDGDLQFLYSFSYPVFPLLIFWYVLFLAIRWLQIATLCFPQIYVLKPLIFLLYPRSR